MRLDRFLCEMNKGTRSQVKIYIRQGLVTVNGMTADNPQQKIDEHNDSICLMGQALSYRKYVYYMMNKPQGTVCATADNTAPTVVELLGPDQRPDIFPAGRLDKDTEGFLLLTNDGALSHRLLAPGRHVEKTYLVTVERKPSETEIRRLEEGVDIGEKKLTLPGKVKVLEGGVQLLLTIHEGKFHQVKRMLQAVDNRVLALKRISFGGIMLDENLAPGEYRELTQEEVDRLHET